MSTGTTMPPELSRGTGRDVEVQELVVQFGLMRAIAELSVRIEAGSRVGVIGPNGAGKSTLLNAITGFVTPSHGSVLIGDRDVAKLTIKGRVEVGVLRSFQTCRLLEGETVFTNVMLGRERFPHASLVEQLLDLPRYRRANRQSAEKAYEIIDLLHLTSVADVSVSNLPFASRRLVEIGRVLVAEPSVLLLDEPGAGLDAGSRELLTEILLETHAQRPSTLLVVEHDMALVRRMCEEIVVLDHGALVAHGPTADVLASPEVLAAYLAEDGHADD